MKKDLNSKNIRVLKIPFYTYISFAITTFLGAFLLFQVQPIISKYILPSFGGTSAVWITAMLFFQTLLLIGYFYVFLISILSVKKQIILHSFLLLSVGLGIFSILQSSHIPVFPDINFKLFDNNFPILQVLGILFIATGLSYFMLSTTSILLQKWLGIIYRAKSPYALYSLSNMASLFALISYPFLVEPFFQLKTQGFAWSAGYLIYSLLLLLCCIQVFYSSLKVGKNNQIENISDAGVKKIGRTKMFLWILFPAISSLMFLATTNLLTQSVAPVPFLLLLPLTLYLISFIICFSGKSWYKRNLYVCTFLITCFLSLVFTFTVVPNLVTGIIVYGTMLFSACMLCHGELYNLRPGSRRLDLYYLLIALGSAISGVLVGIIAPLFFKGLWETYLGFYLTFLLAIWIFANNRSPLFNKLIRYPGISNKEIYAFASILFPVIIIVTPFVLNLISGNNLLSVKTWRNFYGTIAVEKTNSNNLIATVLKHGNIIHGNQMSGNLQYEPTTYYGKNSGIGLAIRNNPKYKKGINIGVMGLGAGTLASYGEKGDNITFFEINPQIIEIAKSEFTYIKNSPAVINIIEGDGRLSLEKEVREKKKKYDLLIMDAFSDDSIPVHLITKEAFDIYLKIIDQPNGIIAVNTSNTYIDIKPVLAQIAKTNKLHYAFILTISSGLNLSSEWALLSYNKQLLEVPAIAKEKYPDSKKYKDIGLWTDNYSNLFQVVK